MTRWIALLRGINLGSRNRVAMPELRERLTAAGFADVQTIVASGNIVLGSDGKDVAERVRAIVHEGFGVDTPVIVRTAAQIAKVVRDNPFPDAGGKELHVLFLEKKCPAATAKALGELELAPEELAVSGKEIYAHYPGGTQKSPMARALTKHVGDGATDRNWNTVVKLRDLVA